MSAPPRLDALLVRHRPELVTFLARRAGVLLLRFESVEDLAQGVQQRALATADRFEYRDDPSFMGWLFTLARRQIAERRDHWFALKRGTGRVFRLTFGGDAVGTATGPATFADRRERLVIMARAIDLLPPRDRDLVRFTADDLSLTEQAQRLGLSYDAVERARARALDRLRKTYRLVSGERAAGDRT